MCPVPGSTPEQASPRDGCSLPHAVSPSPAPSLPPVHSHCSRCKPCPFGLSHPRASQPNPDHPPVQSDVLWSSPAALGRHPLLGTQGYTFGMCPRGRRCARAAQHDSETPRHSNVACGRDTPIIRTQGPRHAQSGRRSQTNPRTPHGLVSATRMWSTPPTPCFDAGEYISRLDSVGPRRKKGYGVHILGPVR